jgi:hypothetical protein
VARKFQKHDLTSDCVTRWFREAEEETAVVQKEPKHKEGSKRMKRGTTYFLINYLLLRELIYP